jgi:hypothetical protein
MTDSNPYIIIDEVTMAKTNELLRVAKCMAEKSYPHMVEDYDRIINRIRDTAESFTGSQNKPRTSLAYKMEGHLGKALNKKVKEVVTFKPGNTIDNAQFDLVEYINKKVFGEFSKEVWSNIEKILHEHIDNPIEGELTKEKLKAANIMGIIHQKEQFPPKVDVSVEGVSMTLTSDILGIRQGDMLIQHNGNRMPVDEIPVEWYEERFIYD